MTRRARAGLALGRVESVEERLAQPAPEPLPGQQAIPLDAADAIRHHACEGLDEHQLADGRRP